MQPKAAPKPDEKMRIKTIRADSKEVSWELNRQVWCTSQRCNIDFYQFDGKGSVFTYDDDRDDYIYLCSILGTSPRKWLAEKLQEGPIL